jgi:2-dehydro-3-deoxy-D-arabinonate dehydratase
MMLVRYVDEDQTVHIGYIDGDSVRRLPVRCLADLLAGDLDRMGALLSTGDHADAGLVSLRAPVDGATEVWAAGVTYRRSRDARMEESREADPYERVYHAERPELFFKSAAWRVSGPGEPVAIRGDSLVDVPEPELAVVVTASGQIAGYTLCNDLTSRSIEGDNPLYLPQAKTYAGSCALGPGIVLARDVPDPGGLVIELEVRRHGDIAFAGRTDTGQMVRTCSDLVGWLYAEQHFPAGAVLSTGTGIVPDLGFSLADGDEVTVRIDGIGELTNPVVRGKQAMAWLLERKESPRGR